MTTAQKLQITDLFLNKFTDQKNAEKLYKLSETINYIKNYNAGLLQTSFIPAKNDQRV